MYLLANQVPFPDPSQRNAIEFVNSDEIGKGILGPPKVVQPAHEDRSRNAYRHREQKYRSMAGASKSPSKTVHYPDHRIQSVPYPPASGTTLVGYAIGVARNQNCTRKPSV